MNIILIYFAIKYKGDWNKIFEALDKKERVSIDEMKELESKMDKEGWKIITILDSNYPTKLKAAYKPPFVLWIDGDEKLLEGPILCLTGNELDEGVEERITKFVPEVEKSMSILSPDFYGVDDKVIEASKNPIIHILASGTDTRPRKFKEGDLLLSEYPPYILPEKDRFRNRNRIIAAFATSLVLFSSKKNGGANHMVNAFLNQGKEIYCFPGDGSEKDGNSELIKQGANLITGIKDISSTPGNYKIKVNQPQR